MKMVLHDYIHGVKQLIVNAALRTDLINYRELFRIFQYGENSRNVFDTLEGAAESLSLRNVAICEALFSGKDGVPGDGFFDIYRNFRRNEYLKIAGDKLTLDLSLEEKREIVRLERARVYAQINAREATEGRLF